MGELDELRRYKERHGRRIDGDLERTLALLETFDDEDEREKLTGWATSNVTRVLRDGVVSTRSVVQSLHGSPEPQSFSLRRDSG